MQMYQKEYYEANKEKMIAKSRANYAANRDLILAKKKNPEAFPKRVPMPKPKLNTEKLTESDTEYIYSSRPTETSHKYFKPEPSNTFSIRYGSFNPFTTKSSI